MKWRRTCAVTILVTAMLSSAILPCAAIEALAQKGPRTEDLAIYFYGDPVNGYTALSVGEIDILAWPLTADQYQGAVIDPDIVLAPYIGNDMFGFVFNINKTIKTYPDPDPKYLSPMAYLEFRQALAYLIDKDYVVDAILGGFAKRIDVPVPYAQRAYWNTSVTGANYPYWYSPDETAELLDGAGFVQGTTPNPYYDLNFPSSAEFIRTYPPGHKYPGGDIDPIVFLTSTEVQSQISAARILRNNMRKAGIPVNYEEKQPGNLIDRVVVDRDFHIYMGGQFTWRFPAALSLLGFWAMMGRLGPKLTYFAQLLAPIRSFMTGAQAIKVIDYQTELWESWASSTYEESMASSKRAQGRYVEAVIGLPLWSTYSYYAYRKDLLGVVNVDGYGIVNKYTFMNAYREGGGPIRIGLVNPPSAMNIMHSYLSFDVEVLNTIYADIMSFAPYDLTADQPWIVQDWDVGTWIHPETGNESSVIDYWFRKDVYAAEPVTGDQHFPEFTAYDYEFTSHYIYAQGYEGYLHIPHWGRFKDIYNVTLIDPFHVQVFMNVSSYWAPNWPTYPMLPKDVWLQDPLANQKSAYFENGVNITLPGPIPLQQKVVSGSADTNVMVQLADAAYVTLEWGRDFTWTRGNLSIKVDSIGGVLIDKVWVDYWIYGDTGGYFPGALGWTETMVGFGPYYVTSFTPGMGGKIGLRMNPFFFMDTPPLGEIDWVWKWGDGPKPRSGYYKIDIYDIVIATGAYGSQGTSVPSSNWFPGADLAPEGGEINIYDTATVTGKYGTTFGHPP